MVAAPSERACAFGAGIIFGIWGASHAAALPTAVAFEAAVLSLVLVWVVVAALSFRRVPMPIDASPWT